MAIFHSFLYVYQMVSIPPPPPAQPAALQPPGTSTPGWRHRHRHLCRNVAFAVVFFVVDGCEILHLGWLEPYNHWIGLRENLQETMVFTIKYGGFL